MIAEAGQGGEGRRRARPDGAGTAGRGARADSDVYHWGTVLHTGAAGC